MPTKYKQFFLKGLEALFQVNLFAKMDIPASQLYPWNHYMINNVEDIVGF